jgi:hypothetical protein
MYHWYLRQFVVVAHDMKNGCCCVMVRPRMPTSRRCGRGPSCGKQSLSSRLCDVKRRAVVAVRWWLWCWRSWALGHRVGGGCVENSVQKVWLSNMRLFLHPPGTYERRDNS